MCNHVRSVPTTTKGPAKNKTEPHDTYFTTYHSISASFSPLWPPTINVLFPSYLDKKRAQLSSLISYVCALAIKFVW